MCKGKDLTCTLTPVTNIKNLDFASPPIPLENRRISSERSLESLWWQNRSFKVGKGRDASGSLAQVNFQTKIQMLHMILQLVYFLRV